jgi:DNA polymerase
MSNNSQNIIINPTKVVTGEVRFSYANLWEPKSINGGTPKYSVSLIIPKDDVKIQATIERQKLTDGKELIRYFCVPCRPTTVGGQRTRNLPTHDTERWRRFKEYNRRDVEAEISIQKMLARFPVPESVWNEYFQDQEINDRGVAVDMALVRSAIEMDERSRTELSRRMRRLTGVDNPNSVQQMKSWLAENGLKADSLGKDAVAEMLKNAPDSLREVLILRQQMAKSSVRKYQAMANAVCSDGRARVIAWLAGEV